MRLIGRNGAGKTTSLKALLNFVHPDAGNVRFFGLSFSENELEIKRRIGFISGGMDAYRKTRLRAITASIRPFYPDWDETAYARLLKEYQLDESKTPDQLSAGMRVKYSLALAVPFAILRQSLPLPGNQVGMDANIAFFGLSFLLLGLMNALFFPRYYAAPNKVGRVFARTAVISGLFIAVLETLAHILPLFRDQLDTPDPQFLPVKLICLGLELFCFGGCTWLAYRCAAARFEKLDL